MNYRSGKRGVCVRAHGRGKNLPSIQNKGFLVAMVVVGWVHGWSKGKATTAGGQPNLLSHERGKGKKSIVFVRGGGEGKASISHIPCFPIKSILLSTLSQLKGGGKLWCGHYSSFGGSLCDCRKYHYIIELVLSTVENATKGVWNFQPNHLGKTIETCRNARERMRKYFLSYITLSDLFVPFAGRNFFHL